MGMFDFVTGIGGSLFGNEEEEKAAQEAVAAKAAQEAADAEQQAALEKQYREEALGMSLTNIVAELGLAGEGVAVSYSEDSKTATITGSVETNEAREKAILALGNLDLIAQVDDQLVVSQPEPEAQFYVVQKGDSLSKIAKEFYGEFKHYPLIFEANKPMLKDPDLIYPGQTLRIPPLA